MKRRQFVNASGEVARAFIACSASQDTTPNPGCKSSMHNSRVGTPSALSFLLGCGIALLSAIPANGRADELVPFPSSTEHLLTAAENELSPLLNSALIEDGALGGITGFTAINLTAGDGNIQQNSGALAVALHGPALAGIVAAQTTDRDGQSPHQILATEIQPNAFNDAAGVIMANLSSGNANTQFNGTAIAIGGAGTQAFIELDDGALAASTSPTGLLDSQQELVDTSIQGSAILASDALQGVQGVVQVSLVAGDLNTTANRFTMSVTQ